MKSEKKFDLMNSISWKNEFRSHEIRPPDPQSLLAVLANFPVQFNGKDGIGYPRPNKLNGKVGVSDQIWVCHWLISNRYPIGLGYLQKFSHWMPHAQPQYKLPQFDQLTFSQKKSLKLYIYIFFFQFQRSKAKEIGSWWRRRRRRRFRRRLKNKTFSPKKTSKSSKQSVSLKKRFVKDWLLNKIIYKNQSSA